MLTIQRHLFNLILRLLVSPWAKPVDEHHSPYEEMVIRRIGPVELETNHCFVLDHADASVRVDLGRLGVGYCACVGSEVARPSGPFITWNGRIVRRQQNQLPDVPF